MRIAPLLVLAVTLLIESVAHAQPSEAERTKARALAIEGHEALERGDYATAEDRYAKADAVVHAPTLLLGLAQAHAGQKKLLRARDEYERIVREGVAPGAPKPWFEALETAKKEIAALEARVPSITARVQGPAMPVAKLDGHALAASELGVRKQVDPGKYVLEASATGWSSQTQTVSVNEGDAKVIVVTLVRVADDGASPASPTEPDAAAKSAPKHPLPLKPIGFIAGGLGVVGVVVGGITGALAMREHAILVDDCRNNRCPPSRQSTLDNFHTLATVSTISFVAGGVGLAAGVALIAIAPSNAPSKKTGIAPYVAPLGGGVRGRF